MKWIYKAESISGNFFITAAWLSQYHPEWDVVAVQMTGNYTIVMYRLPA